MKRVGQEVEGQQTIYGKAADVKSFSEVYPSDILFKKNILEFYSKEGTKVTHGLEELKKKETFNAILLEMERAGLIETSKLLLLESKLRKW